ncbi:unnamed protein product [Cylicocyclus nassatus]|uniref:Uncharacterized protein n=1 Tax=Cylicocyclus nassatus TaxID=53992 RepID=A0AA36H7T9_CYLNA|nr:unnamed protein product [Cylicocyclus nassatus]
MEITFEFFFDLGVALAPIIIPISIVVHSEKLKRQFQSFLRKVGIHSKNAQSLVDFEGNQIKIKAGEETAAYFNQFRAAWS